MATPPSMEKTRLTDTDTIYFLGVDCSVRSTGIYLSTADRLGEQVYLIKPPKRSVEGKRLQYIFQQFKAIVKDKNIKLAVMEGPAFSATNRSYSMGEAYGIIKLVCSLQGIELLLSPPCNIKKYFSGKGHCTKKIMLQKAHTLGYEGVSDDEADSMACSLLALDTHNNTNTPGTRAAYEEVASLRLARN